MSPMMLIVMLCALFSYGHAYEQYIQYEYQYGYSCDSKLLKNELSTEAECKTAGAQLGLVLSAYSLQNSGSPPGCWKTSAGAQWGWTAVYNGVLEPEDFGDFDGFSFICRDRCPRFTGGTCSASSPCEEDRNATCASNLCKCAWDACAKDGICEWNDYAGDVETLMTAMLIYIGVSIGLCVCFYVVICICACYCGKKTSRKV